MARTHRLRVDAIDVVDNHVAKAQRNVECSGLPKGSVRVGKMNYHNLNTFAADSFDGVYTMEIFVHATNPKAILAGFYRILRPGSRLVQFEYDHNSLDSAPCDIADSIVKVNKYAAMPTNAISHPRVFGQMLEDAGFENIVIHDFSDNIRPMTRVFFLLAIIPYFFIRVLKLERYFVNTVAGVQSYKGRSRWHYVAISATKPGDPIEGLVQMVLSLFFIGTLLVIASSDCF
ncbi:S-adenosyl-L-methionine-dependent methyltransferase [Daldinia loculata]|uniref:S-adenosyl-L-methionine-dependent methyltransferase n=1 Tax=Daldinia loculata TaxID=103429 RepID=UPI0020C3ED1C|nr:S-adenosyl-L-methionine-dependent methyltransferase [Daldinia loculata]KAI1650089.1 S-adenosyl-L-methionine-dependent methyltransferase [Daldinia loculata]